MRNIARKKVKFNFWIQWNAVTANRTACSCEPLLSPTENFFASNIPLTANAKSVTLTQSSLQQAFSRRLYSTSVGQQCSSLLQQALARPWRPGFTCTVHCVA